MKQPRRYRMIRVPDALHERMTIDIPEWPMCNKHKRYTPRKPRHNRIQPGKRFGRLVVIHLDHTQPYRRYTWKFWLCQCDCGRLVVVNGNSLLTKLKYNTRACGFCNRRKDRRGKRYGRLVAIKPVEKNVNSWSWLCRCDCGKKIVVRGDLLGLHRFSCGCLYRDNHAKGTRKDETGKRYGKLTVITLHHVHRQCYWLCRCDCGNEIIVKGSRLRCGGTRSCGCLIGDTLREKAWNRILRLLPDEIAVVPKGELVC